MLLVESNRETSFICVTTKWYNPALELYPDSLSGNTAKLHLEKLIFPLGPAHPRSNIVHAEPYSTSVFKILIRIIATTTKICTRHRST